MKIKRKFPFGKEPTDRLLRWWPKSKAPMPSYFGAKAKRTCRAIWQSPNSVDYAGLHSSQVNCKLSRDTNVSSLLCIHRWNEMGESILDIRLTPSGSPVRSHFNPLQQRVGAGPQFLPFSRHQLSLPPPPRTLDMSLGFWCVASWMSLRGASTWVSGSGMGSGDGFCGNALPILQKPPLLS